MTSLTFNKDLLRQQDIVIDIVLMTLLPWNGFHTTLS